MHNATISCGDKSVTRASQTATVNLVVERNVHYAAMATYDNRAVGLLDSLQPESITHLLRKLSVELHRYSPCLSNIRFLPIQYETQLRAAISVRQGHESQAYSACAYDKPDFEYSGL